jgi:hypothetical protein
MEGQRNACNCCGRRNLLTSFGGALLSGASNEQHSQAADVDYMNAKVSILFSLSDFLFLSLFLGKRLYQFVAFELGRSFQSF